jgi:hypothetical protein
LTVFAVGIHCKDLRRLTLNLRQAAPLQLQNIRAYDFHKV